MQTKDFMKTIASTKIVKKLALAIGVLFSMTGILAQEEEVKKKAITISGSVDTYFQTNLSAPDDISQSFGTAFADQQGFSLGMANIIASYESSKTGVVADLTFGPRGDTAIGDYNINQLYAYWNATSKTTLTLGRFNTYLGYEVISPLGNFNYSTSYEFSNGPFSHVGLKVDYAVTEDLNLMFALMNVTDTNNNLTGAYALGGQIGYKGQYLNLYYDGGEVLGFEVDYTGGLDITDTFFLGINAAFDTNDMVGFYGASLYPEKVLSDSFKLGIRAEYFAQTSNIAADESNVFATTLTGSYTVDNLTIKPELRLDTWGNDVQPYLDANGAPTRSLSTFLIAAVYAF